MATLTVNTISKAGLDLLGSLVAADVAGDKVPSASGLLVVIDNADASSHTLTITKPVASTKTANYGSATVDDIAITVAAGDTRAFTVPPGYIDANGDFAWTYDAVTSVTIGVFSLVP